VVGLLLDPQASAAPLGRALCGPPPPAVWLAVGPESGFGAREVAQRAAAGWHPVHLGPRVLRAETAALAAATLVLHHWADLGR
jgi:16S rRNA (uracil1498-N3)-methyltransferase